MQMIKYQITSKDVVILITCVIKDDGKFYPEFSSSEDQKTEIEPIFTKKC